MAPRKLHFFAECVADDPASGSPTATPAKAHPTILASAPACSWRSQMRSRSVRLMRCRRKRSRAAAQPDEPTSRRVGVAI
jgi:hypothetical protein